MSRNHPMDQRSGIFSYRFVLAHDSAPARELSALLEGRVAGDPG